MKSLSVAAAFLIIMSVGAVAGNTAAGPTGVTATLSSTTPEVDVPATFTAAAAGVTGSMTVSWDFGDGSVGSPTSYSAILTTTHTFTKPGHFVVTLRSQDNSGQAPDVAVKIIVHYPVPAILPTNSSTIILDKTNQHVWVVNPDQDTVAVIDTAPVTPNYLTEIEVGKNPRTLAQAADKRIWVVSQQHPSISILAPTTPFALEHVVPLPHGSLPYGIAMSPDGGSAYVTFQGSGGVAKFDTASRTLLATNPAPLSARGVSVATNGHVFVTRFISPQTDSLLAYNDPVFLANNRGEVVEFTSNLALVRDIRLGLSPQSNFGDPDFGNDTATTAKNSRGIPNYLTSMVISPDGRRAYVPSKKDNIQRGTAPNRDGLTPGAETTYRAIVSQIDLVDTGKTTDELADRWDVDNSEMPQFACISPLGDWLFLALQGNNRVQIRDLYKPESTNLMNDPGQNTGTTAISSDGLSPQGLVIDDSGAAKKLYVQNYMGRTVTIFDITSVLDGSNISLLAQPKVILNTVLAAPDKLNTGTPLKTPLIGKQVFYNAVDPRMSSLGYVSCAGCHLDGAADMRVFDFTNRGEGLRNTIMLQGRGNGVGPKHGNVHWSGNFDEIQDFDNDVYFRFHDGNPAPPGPAGSSFTTNPNGPMAATNANRNNDLDALAAYVNSLTKVSRSPFRNADGSLTASGAAGEIVFDTLNCKQCHGGREFTDSGIFTDPNLLNTPPSLHNVGTLKTTSGQRLGNPLPGIDTPTLKGLWQTAPYFHDGSAATIMDVINAVPNTTPNAHGGMHLLTDQQKADLAEYLLEIDELDAPPSTATSPKITIDYVSTGKPYSLAVDAATALPYVDRSYRFLNSPAAGFLLLRTAEDDKAVTTTQHVQLTVPAGTVIYIAYDARGTLPDWISATYVQHGSPQFTENFTGQTGVTMKYWKSPVLPAGQVWLGGNLAPGASGALRNYTAIIISGGLFPVPTDFNEGPINKDEWAHDQDADGDGVRDEFEVLSGLNPWVADTGGAGVIPDEDKLASAGVTFFQAQPAYVAFAAGGGATGGGGGGGGGCGLMGLEYVLPLLAVRLRRRRRV